MTSDCGCGRCGERNVDHLDLPVVADLQQSQATCIELDCLGEMMLIETAPADRDRAADQMRSSRAVVHAEPLTQLHQRRARLVEGHQFVHLRRAQKGLSHPNSAHHAPSRVHHGRLQWSPISSVDPPRPARSHRSQSRARVLELSTEVHSHYLVS